MFEHCTVLNPNFKNLTNYDKFIFLMSVPEVIRSVSVYIEKAWNARKVLMFK